MRWLVTGGAGYIGAHVVRAFAAAGKAVVALDDLSTGVASFVPAGIPLVVADVRDADAVAAALDEHRTTGVVHCAGYKLAGASVTEPLAAYDTNVEGTRSLLEAMDRAEVRLLVFSSSAAVYGTPSELPVAEQAATNPESPYGRSKLAAEWLISDWARADATGKIAYTCLRYFNVVGSAHPDVWDASPAGLFANAFRAVIAREPLVINGDDYPTRDGTCVRDYVHAGDLAKAHVAAAHALADHRVLAPAYNLGSGEGVTVREAAAAALVASGTNVPPVVGPRRVGDPAAVVADDALARRGLGWGTTRSVAELAASAWAAFPR